MTNMNKQTQDKTETQMEVYDKALSPEEIQEEYINALVTPADKPEDSTTFSPALQNFTKELVDKSASHTAVRNIENISTKVGHNRPVIAGRLPKQRTQSEKTNQPLKSIPGTRTGVVVIDPNKDINNINKTNHA